MRKATVLLAGMALILSAGPALSITVDGTAEGLYGPPISVQATQTQFGDANLGQQGFCNGSELDAAYAVIQGNRLGLFLAGNLESNFNKLEIFFDTRAGGQNKLRGDNPNVDFNGLNRMGDDGSGNGLTFDSGFEADYWIGITGGDAGGYQMFANWAEILTTGGGSGDYLGQTGAASGGALTGGNDHGIRATIDNSNTGGVPFGCDAASGAGVIKGVELDIPLDQIGTSPGHCINIVVFVNGGGHDFVSNQVLAPLVPSQCNLGEPRTVNLNQFAGSQVFQICDGTVAVQPESWSNIKSLYR